MKRDDLIQMAREVLEQAVGQLLPGTGQGDRGCGGGGGRGRGGGYGKGGGGGGYGRGGGGGRGRGRGFGGTMGSACWAGTPGSFAQPRPQEERGLLENYCETLQRQLNVIKQRLEELSAQETQES